MESESQDGEDGGSESDSEVPPSGRRDHVQSIYTASEESGAVECDYSERTPLLGSMECNGTLGSSARTSVSSTEDSISSASSSEESSFSLFNLSRKQTFIILNTCFADVLVFLSISVMAPFFPEEALKKDVSDTLSGWIFGTAPLIQFIFSPICGKLLPIVGTNFMYISGIFLAGGCTVLFGFLTYVPTENGNAVFLVLAFALQTVKSIGSAATSTASFVLLAQSFPNNLSTVFGIAEIFVGLGLVTGPAIGGVLYGMGGFLLPFVTIGGLCVLLLPILWYLLPPPAEIVDSNEEKLPMSAIFRSPTAMVTSVAIVISTYSWSILDPTLEPHLRQFDLSPELVGLIFLVMAGVYALSSPIWGWVADKMSDQRPLLIPGFLLAALGQLLLAPSRFIGLDETDPELWLIVVALIVLGVAASMSSVPTFELYVTVFEKLGFDDSTRTYGIVAGLWMSMYSLGDFLGPSLGGVLLDNFGFPMMATYTALVCLAMAALLLGSWLVDVWRSCPCCRDQDGGNKDWLGTKSANYGTHDLSTSLVIDSVQDKNGVNGVNAVLETRYMVDSV